MRTTRAAGAARRVQQFGSVLTAVTVIALSGTWSSRVESSSALAAAPPSRAYVTSGFFAGAMSVRLERGWHVLEDSRLHLSATAKDPDYRVLWSVDASPVHSGTKVSGIASLAAPLIGWLRNSRDLRVVEARRSTIGSKLPARVIDVTLGPNAVNDDPGCPARKCVNFLRFGGATEDYGIAGDDAIRFYLADIKIKGRRHLLIVAIEARNQADLTVRRPAAERLIHTATLVVTPG
jgi:hypothetical protein